MKIAANILLFVSILVCNLLMYYFGYKHGALDTLKDVEKWIDENNHEQGNSK